LVGAFVLVGTALAVGAVVVFGSGDIFKKKVPCVMFFDGNINGLTVGSKVKFRGVPVGSVVGIDMPIKIADGVARIPVYAELSQGRTYTRQALIVTHDRIEEIVANGMRARLDTESLLTGLLYVDLDVQPSEPAVLIGAGPEGYVEIPTLPTRVGEVIRKVMAALEEVDIKDMIESITSAAHGIDDLAHSPRIDQGFTAVDQTLARYRDLASTLDANVKTLSKEIEGTLSSARSALSQTETAMKTGETSLAAIHELAQDLRQDSKSVVAAVRATADTTQDVERRLASTIAAVEVVLDPEAPLVQQLRETLVELGRASRSLAEFADELQRNPSAVVRGRDTERKKP
jgi:paraquat-inducible protein B